MEATSELQMKLARMRAWEDSLPAENPNENRRSVVLSVDTANSRNRSHSRPVPPPVPPAIVKPTGNLPPRSVPPIVLPNRAPIATIKHKNEFDMVPGASEKIVKLGKRLSQKGGFDPDLSSHTQTPQTHAVPPENAENAAAAARRRPPPPPPSIKTIPTPNLSPSPASLTRHASSMSSDPDSSKKELSKIGKVLLGHGTTPVPTTTEHQIQSNENELPNGFEDTKEFLHYFKAVYELVTSEFKYFCDLYLVNVLFVNPIQARYGAGFSRRIFSIWDELLKWHKILLDRMISEVRITLEQLDPTFVEITSLQESSKTSYSQGISYQGYVSVIHAQDAVDIAKLLESCQRNIEAAISTSQSSPVSPDSIASMVNTLAERLSYVMVAAEHSLKNAIPYIVNYPKALEFVEDLVQSKPDSASFISQLESNPELKGLKLRDFLIKPVQRVCKYPLLVREIIRKTKSDKTLDVLTKCQKTLTDVADRVNYIIKKFEEDFDEKLRQILPGLKPLDMVSKLGLNSKNCRLLRCGEVEVTKILGYAQQDIPRGLLENPKIQGLLCDDLLVFIEPYSSLFGGKNQYRIIGSISFKKPKVISLKVSAKENDECVFLIHISHPYESIYEIKTKGSSIRDGWVDDFKEICRRVNIPGSSYDSNQTNRFME